MLFVNISNMAVSAQICVFLNETLAPFPLISVNTEIPLASDLKLLCPLILSYRVIKTSGSGDVVLGVG